MLEYNPLLKQESLYEQRTKPITSAKGRGSNGHRFFVSLIVPEDLMLAIKSGTHVYQKSSFLVSPLWFLRVS